MLGDEIAREHLRPGMDTTGGRRIDAGAPTAIDRRCADCRVRVVDRAQFERDDVAVLTPDGKAAGRIDRTLALQHGKAGSKTAMTATPATRGMPAIVFFVVASKLLI